MFLRISLMLSALRLMVFLLCGLVDMKGGPGAPTPGPQHTHNGLVGVVVAAATAAAPALGLALQDVLREICGQLGEDPQHFTVDFIQVLVGLEAGPAVAEWRGRVLLPEVLFLGLSELHEGPAL